jgi:predicted dinucleotide-binding enzyme
MKITTIGRGEIGGTLGRLWAAAGHDVTQLGRDGGGRRRRRRGAARTARHRRHEALAGISGLGGKVILDATNRLASQTPPPTGYDSIAEHVKATTGGPVAKVFNLNYGAILAQRPAPRDDPATSGSETKAHATRCND